MEITIAAQPDQPAQTITLPDPTLAPTPGAGQSFDSNVTTELATNDSLYLQEVAKAQAIFNYLLAVANWKVNGVQQQANGLPVSPAPVPPAGYTPAPAPAAAPAPPPNYTAVVHPENQFGQYAAPGDINPAGTKIPNPYVPGGTLTKVVQSTPFGDSMWWVAVV